MAAQVIDLTKVRRAGFDSHQVASGKPATVANLARAREAQAAAEAAERRAGMR
jgi:hypothetical protein